MRNHPTVSVIIPCRNESSATGGKLPRLFENLKHPTNHKHIHEIIIVDNGSNKMDNILDDILSFCTSISSQIRHILITDRNIDGSKHANITITQVDSISNVSQARNIGAKQASGEVLLFLDADVVPQNPETIQQIVLELITRNLQVGKILFSPDKPERKGSRILVDVINWLLRFGDKNPDKSHGIGAGIIISKKAHDNVSGFDETMTVCEDSEYLRRLHKNGSISKTLENSRLVFDTSRIYDQNGKVNLQNLATYAWNSIYYTFTGLPSKGMKEMYKKDRKGEKYQNEPK